MDANPNIDLGAQDEGALKVMQEHTLKRLNTLKRLSTHIGIKMAAVNNAETELVEQQQQLDFKVHDEEKAIYQINNTEREKIADQEKVQAEKEQLEYVKTIRMISKGMIDVMSIIKKPAVKRSNEEQTQLAYFLQYRVEFFRD